jgi:hypothetical protein
MDDKKKLENITAIMKTNDNKDVYLKVENIIMEYIKK